MPSLGRPGAVFSQEKMDEIFQCLQDLPQEAPIIFSDEMYRDMMSSAPTNAGRPNSIVLSGLSKPWGMPGLRTGWLIMQNRCSPYNLLRLFIYIYRY